MLSLHSPSQYGYVAGPLLANSLTELSKPQIQYYCINQLAGCFAEDKAWLKHILLFKVYFYIKILEIMTKEIQVKILVFSPYSTFST